jgi:hypothetical protein
VSAGLLTTVRPLSLSLALIRALSPPLSLSHANSLTLAFICVCAPVCVKESFTQMLESAETEVQKAHATVEALEEVPTLLSFHIPLSAFVLLSFPS